MRSILPLNWFLLAVAAGLGALLFLLAGDGVEARPVESLFPEFDGSRATSLTVAAPSEALGEDNGERVSLARVEAGEPWTIDQLFDAQASSLIVDGFLARIGAMSTLDLVNDDPARLDEYELDEGTAVRVTVRGDAGSEARGDSVAPTGPPGGLDGSLDGGVLLADVYIARATETAAFVRRAGDARVYRIAGLRVPPTGPFTWFDRSSLARYENVQIAKVTASGSALGKEVVLEQPLERFGTYRDAAGNSVPSERARDVLQRLRALFPSEVLGRQESDQLPVDETSFAVDIALRTGNVFRLTFGDLEGDDAAGVPVMRSGDTLVVACDRQAVSNLVAALRQLAD